MTYSIRQLHTRDAIALRETRLEALCAYPLHYTGTYEAESQHDAAWFAHMLNVEIIFGAWDDANGALFATACLAPDTRPRNAHKATLRMVYVRADQQGKGVAKALLAHTLKHGAQYFEQIVLSVEATNHQAIRLYESFGFITYGREPRAAKVVDGHYLDDILMIAFTQDILI